jgi:chromosome segregation ATPase
MSSKKDKGGKGKVETVAEVAAVSGDANKVIELESQVKELKVALRKAEETLAARDREMEAMRAETASSREKVADALRNSARRIAQVALLEATLEEQRRKEEMLELELHKHSQMMDSVMNYRDKETSREYHEILRESTQRRLIEPGQCACVRTCARPCLQTESGCSRACGQGARPRCVRSQMRSSRRSAPDGSSVRRCSSKSGGNL